MFSYLNKYLIILLHLIFIALIGCLYLIYVGSEISTGDAIFALSVVFLLSSIWQVWSWNKITNSLFNPYILFLIGAIIFNGGQILLEIFGLNEFGIFGGGFPDHLIIKTIFFITFGLALFHLGALVSYRDDRKYEKTQLGPFDNEESILWVGWFLFAISILPALYVTKNYLNTVMTFGYFGMYEEARLTGLASAPSILKNLITPAAIFILIGGRKRKILVLFSLFIILFFAGINFFIGIRSIAILPLIAYTWTWHKVIKPIPASILLIGGGITLIVIFPLISLTRNLGGVYRFNFTFLWDAFLTINNPMVAIFSEMGITSKTVAHTIQLVPSVKSYEMGLTYFYGLFSAVPNFFTDIHPAQAYGTPSDWLVWAVNPWMARRGGGMGYSFIAEAYLNFGWYGGLLTFIGLGYLFSNFFNLADNKNKLGKIALVASFLAFGMKYTRADINSVIRPLIWYAVIPYLLIYMHYILKKCYSDHLLILHKKESN